MTNPNNDNVTSNDGERRKHRNKWMKRITSKLRRQHSKQLVKEQNNE
jgi:hypothetical protein